MITVQLRGEEALGKLRQVYKYLMGGDEEKGTRKCFFKCILGLIPPVAVNTCRV